MSLDNVPRYTALKGPDGYYWMVLSDAVGGGVHWALLGPSGATFDAGKEPDHYVGRDKNLQEVSKKIRARANAYFKRWTDSDGVPVPPAAEE